MDRGTCFCRISGCGEFHTTCFTGHPLTDKHKEKCNCGSWPDPHWTENDYRRKEEAKRSVQYIRIHPSGKKTTYDKNDKKIHRYGS